MFWPFDRDASRHVPCSDKLKMDIEGKNYYGRIYDGGENTACSAFLAVPDCTSRHARRVKFGEYILYQYISDSGLYFVLGLVSELAKITAQIDAFSEIGCILRCDGGVKNEKITAQNFQTAKIGCILRLDGVIKQEKIRPRIGI